MSESASNNEWCTPCRIKLDEINIHFDKNAYQTEWEVKKTLLEQLVEMRQIALNQSDIESQEAIDQLIFKYLTYLLRRNAWWASFEEETPLDMTFARSMKYDFSVNPLLISETNKTLLKEYYEKNGI
ncbi:hypothetical protein ACNPKB_10560 [Shewanella marisflavi]|uniref:hypothetical protein n=1 Tax=Shewanella marisflavi TaxID=260364 RepID=UPI003AAE59C3